MNTATAIVGAVTAGAAKFALYLAVGLFVGLMVREYAKAQAATRLGDMTPKLYGRATLRPKPHFDPLGTAILPGFLLLLVAAGLSIAPFAWAKPMPLSPDRLRNPNRDIIWVSLAGPGANLALAIAAGVVLRLTGFRNGEVFLFIVAWLQANIVLCVFHLMPIPGLDSSRILARFLHGRAREIYTNLDQFLPLFMIVIYFLLSAPVLAFVRFLGNALCQPIAGFDCL
ncbi:MAG TPA: site-2 protease family protein [Actinomycetota bacterium]|jgi:Zn-dependent protease